MLLRFCAGLLITGCTQQTFTVQNKPAAVTPKETITVISSFLELGEKETVDTARNLWRRRKCVKTETPANIRKWIARFYYFRHLYSAGSLCVLTIIA